MSQKEPRVRAITVERLGGPEVLAVAERPDPRPGAGQVVVATIAAGVNYMDIYQRQGQGGYRLDPPFTPGGEGAGTVAAVGEGVTGLAEGDLIAWAGAGGSYASMAVVPAERAVRVPPGIDPLIAAAVMP